MDKNGKPYDISILKNKTNNLSELSCKYLNIVFFPNRTPPKKNTLEPPVPFAATPRSLTERNRGTKFCCRFLMFRVFSARMIMNLRSNTLLDSSLWGGLTKDMLNCPPPKNKQEANTNKIHVQPISEAFSKRWVVDFVTSFLWETLEVGDVRFCQEFFWRKQRAWCYGAMKLLAMKIARMCTSTIFIYRIHRCPSEGKFWSHQVEICFKVITIPRKLRDYLLNKCISNKWGVYINT